MKKNLTRNKLRKKRKRRVHVVGNKEVPRFSVFRSNRRVFLQLIDDTTGKTIIGVRSDEGKDKISLSFKAGEKLGKLAASKKIERIVFDRGGYKFHGRVKAALEGAIKNGLKCKKN
jgi:large subunit ribosomal protein L18